MSSIVRNDSQMRKSGNDSSPGIEHCSPRWEASTTPPRPTSRRQWCNYSQRMLFKDAVRVEQRWSDWRVAWVLTAVNPVLSEFQSRTAVGSWPCFLVVARRRAARSRKLAGHCCHTQPTDGAGMFGVQLVTQKRAACGQIVFCYVDHMWPIANNRQEASYQDPSFLQNIVTGNGTWCYRFDPELKHSPTSPPSKKSCLQKEKVKTMLIAFFDNDGIISTRNLFLRANTELRRTRNWMLLHGNAPEHCAIRVRKFLAQCGIPVLRQLPYLSDLADPHQLGVGSSQDTHFLKCRGVRSAVYIPPPLMTLSRRLVGGYSVPGHPHMTHDRFHAHLSTPRCGGAFRRFPSPTLRGPIMLPPVYRYHILLFPHTNYLPGEEGLRSNRDTSMFC
ncbi:hypothetical protein PR048_025061 [Dryococelus australis]|uniref:Tc1-like transposase DDE domain-containing protein n=1 Tax=Dryococelus australis TaxID=614101 RepID=A0ABQ9GQC3_9NEOP|nr:hypothetical protein PR048_025061 [Dryococelus australis]